MSFSVIVNNIGIFDNVRKRLPRRKTKRKILEKNRRFVESGIVKTCDEIDLSEHRPKKKLKIRFVKRFFHKRDVV